MLEQVLDLVVKQVLGLFLLVNHPRLLGFLLAPASLVVVDLSEQVGATVEFLLMLSLPLVALRLTYRLQLLQQHLSVVLTVLLRQHCLLGCQSQRPAASVALYRLLTTAVFFIYLFIRHDR